MKYTKKPVTIDAIQYTGLNGDEIKAFVGQDLKMELESETAYVAGQGAPIFSILIPTMEGVMKAMPQDFIIRGIKGEYYPCKPDIFEGSYSIASPDRSEYDKCVSTKHNSICLQRAADDEPIFVLRAKDPTAPEIVEEWCSRNNDLQPIGKVGGAMILADKMREWREENVKHGSC